MRVSSLNQNFWEQELVAAATIELGWRDLFRDRFAAGEPPLYYALLKAIGLSGASELTLRLPSAVLDALAGGTLAWLARRISGRIGAAALVLAFAFMPVLIRFGQEARPYPLLCFFFAVAFGAAAIVWRNPRQAVAAFQWGRRRPHQTLFRGVVAILFVAMVGAGWTMVIGWAAVLGVQGAILATPRVWRVPGMRRLWLVLSGVTWLAIAPCIVAVAPHLGHFAAILWTPDPAATTADSIASDLHSIYGWSADGDLNRFFPRGWEIYLGIVAFALAVVAAVRDWSRPPIPQAAVIALAFPLVLFALDISRSLVALRHVHPSLWCICLLYADGAAVVARRWSGRAALLVLAVCVVLQGIDGAQAERKASWTPFLQFFQANGLAAMRGYVTEPALALLVTRSLPARSPVPRIAVDEDAAALRTDLTRALSADAPVWVLTSRPLANVLAGLPSGIASCAGTISYHAFIVMARSFSLLPPQIGDCATAGPPSATGGG